MSAHGRHKSSLSFIGLDALGVGGGFQQGLYSSCVIVVVESVISLLFEVFYHSVPVDKREIMLRMNT